MSESKDSWKRAILSIDATISQAIENLNEASVKIVIVTNKSGVLEGTISDGDIRRGLLRGLDLASPISTILRREPFVVPPQMGRAMVLQIMAANKIQQIPIVDQSQRVIGLHLWDEINVFPNRENLMVIMCGGKGTRLMPKTENCPKPLLHVAGKPILEHIIDRAKSQGFTRFVLAIYHLGSMIEDYFGDGTKLGVEIQYLREDAPLGTAGALSLFAAPPSAPFIVTNGDVLTDINYGELLDFHHQNEAKATMAVRLHEWQNPFGVVQIDGLEIIGYEEKPITRSHINAGVYVIDPSTLGLLTKAQPCDMPIFFEQIQQTGQRVLAYPIHEHWIDVGRPDDFLNANKIDS